MTPLMPGLTMTAPVRLQLSRKKGFSLQSLSRTTNGLECVNVARPSRWGNPFRIGLRIGNWPVVRDHEHAVTLHRHWFTTELRGSENNPFVQAAFKSIRGKNLACWCKPGDPCHADVLLEMANRPAGAEAR